MCLVLLLTGSLSVAACTSDSGDDKPSKTSASRSQAPANGSGKTPDGKWFDQACGLPSKIVKRVERDLYPGRSPELIALPVEPNYYGGFIGTSHSGPWEYVQRIPIALYGPGFIASAGEIAPQRETTLADIAPTIAELVGIEWPGDRPGRVLEEALVPAEERSGVPKLIVTVVWDGGGWNVLDQWKDSWPNLRSLMDRGAVVTNATVGSSPSNTPPAHTNIGTGAFPNQHGIIDLKIRIADDVVDPLVGKGPRYLELDTIGDIYDREVNNEAEIGLFGYHPWHLGMLGHGTYSEGGDKDLVALVANAGTKIIGLPKWYEFPSYANSIEGLDDDIQEADASDGQLDGLWLGNDSLNDPFELKQSPAYILYQTRIVEAMLEREGFGQDDIADLFFVNYKPLDPIGHKFNMLEPEVKSAVEFSDGEIGKLEKFLDATVGKGEWVMIMTADHGQTPAAEFTETWPIKMDEVMADAATRFDMSVKDLFVEARVGYFWMNTESMKDKGVTLEQVADFMSTYTIGDNITDGDPVPDGYEDRLDERVIEAAWPSEHTAALASCTKP